jgi:hypothetical protein
MTSSTLSIQLACILLGVPLPVWVVSAGFGYFSIPYIVQVLAMIPVLISMWYFFIEAAPPVILRVCPSKCLFIVGQMPILVFIVTIITVVTCGILFKILAQYARSQLLRRNIWFKGAGGG